MHEHQITPSALLSAQGLRHVSDTGIDWVQANGTAILLSIAAAVLIYAVLQALRRRAWRVHHAQPDPLGVVALIARILSHTTHSFMIALAARLVTGYADPPTAVLMTIRFVFTIIAVFQSAIWIREFVLGLIERRAGGEGQGESLASAMGIIRLLVTIALFAIALIVVLDNLGVNVTGLVAGLGIGGIAIGLAAQGIFSDLFAALSVVFDKPFQIGDTIQYDTTIATVEHIGLKSTRLRALTGERKIIANAQLLQKEITNYEDLTSRRVSLPIGVTYQTPPDVARRIPDMLRALVEAREAKLVRCCFTGFGASSLDFECLIDIPHGDITSMAALRHDLGLAILERFSAEGIDFAYPTQTTFTAAPDGRMILPYAELFGGLPPQPARE